jgi:hypothetical protein
MELYVVNTNHHNHGRRKSTKYRIQIIYFKASDATSLIGHGGTASHPSWVLKKKWILGEAKGLTVNESK